MKKDAAISLKGRPVPPGFPDDVDDMSSEDWTALNVWALKFGKSSK